MMGPVTTVLPRLRQAVLAAWDLSATAAALRADLGLVEGYHDPGVGAFGLVNEVLAVGDTFLEVVSPTTPGSATAAGRFLGRVGDRGGYMAIFQVPDTEAARARIAAQGLRIVWTGEHEIISGTHIHPADLGGAIVSLDAIAPDGPLGAWPWAGPQWEDRRSTDRVTAITGIEVAAADPAAMCARWAAVIDAPHDNTTLSLADGGWVRFRPAAMGEPEGIVAIDFTAADSTQPAMETLVAGCALRIGAA